MMGAGKQKACRERRKHMTDYISLGPVPAYENCQQVGTDHYDPEKARKECLLFIEAIRETLGPEPHGARLKVKSFPHEFGWYYDVVVQYDDEFPDAVEYAFRCESDAPARWTAEQRRRLVA
jgi:hypothetical protein